MLKQDKQVIEVHRQRPRNGSLLLTGLLWLLALALVSCTARTTAARQAPIAQTSPAPVPTTQALHATCTTFDGVFTLTLTITPNRAGPNTFLLSILSTSTHQPVQQVTVTLYTTMQDMSMGTDSLTLQEQGQGYFGARGDNLDMGGHWAIGIVIQTPDHALHKAGLRFITSP